MDKIKINLLPREVLEKRKAEQQLALMLLGLIVMVIAMASIYGFNFIRISQEQTDLELIKAENQKIQAQIAKVEDFEKNKILVEEREKLVNAAVAGKYSWSRFLNSVSLIVPNEVWLQSLTVEKGGKVSFAGRALGGSMSSGIGHRPVAKWLVHLAEMIDIGDVWLSSSKKSANSGSAQGPASVSSSSTVDATQTIDFATTANIKSLQVPVPSIPAPPASGGTPSGT